MVPGWLVLDILSLTETRINGEHMWRMWIQLGISTITFFSLFLLGQLEGEDPRDPAINS